MDQMNYLTVPISTRTSIQVDGGQHTPRQSKKLISYLKDRQAFLSGKLQTPKETFLVQESEQQILLQKLKSVNGLMKYLIQTNTDLAGVLSPNQSYRLLDMVEGALKKNILGQDQKEAKRVPEENRISRQQLIQRCKLRLKKFRSKSEIIKENCQYQTQSELRTHRDEPNGSKNEGKHRRSFRVDGSKNCPRLSYSDNHLYRSKGQDYTN